MIRFRRHSLRIAARHLAVVLVLALVGPALAHHSVSNFDQDKRSQITGVVAYVSFTNPHSYFDIDVKGERRAEKYKVFATSKVALLRYGWRPDSVKVGDTISIEGWPDRTNPHYLYMLKIRFADGTEWSRNEIPK
jgi:hypothetical protein